MTDINAVQSIVDNALTKMIIELTTLANFVTRIGVKVVSNEGIPAMAYTDGTGIYINAPYVDYANENPIIEVNGRTVNQAIKKDQMIFLICHEAMHLLSLTFDRGIQKGIPSNAYAEDKVGCNKFKTWNVATDYEINSMLHNNRTDGAATPIGKLPETVLYDSKYIDVPAEKIYDELYKEDEDIEKQLGLQTIKSLDEEGGLVGFDSHMPILDDATRSEILEKIHDTFGSTSNGTGCSALDRALEIAYKPIPFNWRKALTKYIRDFIKDSYTWNKPSRAGIAQGLILPSQGSSPKLHLAVAIDTSGSISNKELTASMQHLYTILQQFKDFTIDVWCCGSEVYEDTLKTFTVSNKNEIIDYRFESDGGNDMRKNFEFMRNHYRGNPPNVLLILSDFYDPLDGDTETTSICPVVGLVLDHPGFVPPKNMNFTAFPFELEGGKSDD